MRRHEPCKYMDFFCEYSIEGLVEFQDNLGPPIVLNHRTGRFNLKYFDNNPSSLLTTVYCSDQPLESYITDGVDKELIFKNFDEIMRSIPNEKLFSIEGF
jgi:hypothetical protein